MNRCRCTPLLSPLLAWIAVPSVEAADFTTITGGVWGDAAIWTPAGFVNGTLNTAGNTAIIGHDVTYSGGGGVTPVNAAFQMANGTTLTLEAGGSLLNTSLASWFMAGFSGSPVTLNLNGGVLNPGNAQLAMFGVNGGSALVNLNEGILRAGTNSTEAGGFTFAGASSINLGITNGSNHATGTLNLGDGAGSAGSAVIDLATNNRNLNIGWVADAAHTGRVKAVLNVAADGVINAGSSTQIRIGRGAALDGDPSELNINGGSVNAPGALNTFIVGGLLNNAHGRLSLNSGMLSAGTLRLANANATIKGEYLQAGGTATIGTIEYHHGNADVVLSGGTTAVNAFTFVNPASPGVRTLLLDGGTLRARADAANFLPAGLNFTATLGASGGTIDTNGFAISIAAPLGGNGALTKSGSGTLSLAGTQGFTGTTTVAAGALRINGLLESSAVTVESGGTLGGSGTLGAATTVKSGGRLCPGGGSGQLTNNAPVVLQSGVAFVAQLDSGNGTSGLLVANDSVALNGASLVIEDLDTTPVVLPAGTELPVIDFATFPLTGTFAGLPEGATVVGGLNEFIIRYADSGRVTLTATGAGDPYLTWALAAGLDGSPGKESRFDADPDRDGAPNGLEWVLGGLPLDGASGSLVTATAGAAAGLTLKFTREPDTIGQSSLVVEYSATLDGIWNTATIGEDSSGPDANGVGVAIDTSATPHKATVTIPASNAPGGRLFARLRATRP